MDVQTAVAFLQHPKFLQYKHFVDDYVEAMKKYIEKHPEKSTEPYMEFFADLMQQLSFEQEKADFLERQKGEK